MNSSHRLKEQLLAPIGRLLAFLTITLLLSQQAKPLLSNQSSYSSGFNYTLGNGVTFDQDVSSIYLDGNIGIKIPLDSLQLNHNLDYTIMTWFKPKNPQWNQAYQFTFQFPNSLECYFTPLATFACESSSLSHRLSVNTSSVYPNQWAHIAVSGSQIKGTSLMISQNLPGILDSQQMSYLGLVQTQQSWYICLGSCTQLYAFIGNFREFAFYKMYIDQATIYQVKNQYLEWRNELLGYYRFNSVNLAGEQYRQRNAILTAQSFNSEIEFIPNDICYPIYEVKKFISFQGRQLFYPVSIDSRWQPKSTEYGYSISMWLKIDPSTCTTQAINAGTSSCFLVQLENVFSLFMAGPNQIAAYIFGDQPYFDFSTQSVFIPYNSWVNVQFALSYNGGYEMRVYDILGRQQSALVENMNLYPQSTNTKQIIMPQGFFGELRNILLYSNRYSLPLSNSNLEIAPDTFFVNDTDCIAFFQFQQQDIVTYAQQLLELTNYCKPPKASFDNATFYDYPNFAYQPWSTLQLETNSLDLISPINTTLFDGISCNQSTQYPLFISNQSSVSNPLGQINQTFPNLTVEFWFKIQSQSINDTRYLFQLWGQNHSIGYFSIFYNSQGSLLCAPFDLITSKAPFISYEAFNSSTVQQNSWMHLSCQYEQFNYLNGTLYTKGQQYNYNFSLATDLEMIYNDNFTVYIGNDRSGANGSTSFMVREFRLWGSQRLAQDIQRWRFVQINPQSQSYPNLLSYIRFNQGEEMDKNLAVFIGAPQNAGQVQFLGINLIPDTGLDLCPVDTYLSDDMKCYSNPVMSLKASVYPQTINNSLYWTFTTQNSFFIDPSYLNTLQPTWSFKDATMEAIVASSQINGNSSMRIPASYFRDESFYNVRVNYTNMDNTFLVYQDFIFVPQSCQYYIVDGSNAFGSFYNSTVPQSTNDISFLLDLVQQRQDCSSNYFNQISQQITFDMIPPQSQLPTLQYTFNSNGSITVTLPKSQQSNLPLGTNLQFVFKIQWTNNELQNQIQMDPNTVFQNIQYTIRFNSIGQSLVPSLITNATAVLNPEGLLLDASQTSITNSATSDYQRLSYSWTCPSAFQTYCSGQNGSQLTIPSSDFQSANLGSNQSLNFTVNLFYTQANGQQLNDSQSIPVQYINQTSTMFNIMPPSPVLASAVSQIFNISFDFINNQTLPQDLQITWSIVPNLTKNTSTFSNNNQILTVNQGGFNFSTSYNLTVYAYYTSSPSFSLRTQSLSFYTKQPPQNGTVSITPTSGYVNLTNFTVSLQNWQSSYPPIQYRVWTTQDLNGTVQALAPLSQNYIQASQNFTFQVNNTNSYLVEITDQSMETVYITLNPNVSIQQNSTNTNNTGSGDIQVSNQTTNSTSSTNSSNSTSNTTGLVQILYTKTLIAKYQQLNQYVNNSSQTTQNSSYQTPSENQIILTSINVDINSVKSGQINSIEARTITKGSAAVIASLLNNTSTLNSSIVSQSLSTVQRLQSADPQVYNTLIQDKSFQVSLANIASGALTFVNSYKKKGRMLQQDQIIYIDGQARTLIGQLSQQLCQDSVVNSGQQVLDAPAFNLQTQKFSFDTSIPSANFSFFDQTLSSISFNIKDIMQQTNMVQNFCIQSTFYKINPEPLAAYSEQYTQYQSSIIDFEVLDDSNNSTYSSVNSGTVQSMSFSIFNSSSFKNNQTVCMLFSNQSQTWDQSQCLTSINQTSMEVQCSCSMNDSLYFGVFIDQSRKQGPPISTTFSNNSQNYTSQDSQSTPSHELYIQQNDTSSHSFIFIAIVAVILMFTTLVPASLIAQDKRDLKNLNEKKITNDEFQLLQSLEKLSNLPQLYWYYKRNQFPFFNNATQTLIFQKSHPIIDLFSTFDFEHRRIWRYTSVILNMSLFTMVVTLVFGQTYRQEDPNRLFNGLDQQDLKAAVLVGLLGMIMMLPFPLRNVLFKDQIQNGRNRVKPRVLNYLSDGSGDKAVTSPSKPQQTNQRITAISNYFNDDNRQQEPVVFKRCYYFRFVLLISSICMFLASIALLFYQSQLMPISNQYCQVLSFFIGIFGNILLINLARAIISVILGKKRKTCQGKILVANEAQELFENIEAYMTAMGFKNFEETAKMGKPTSFNSSKKELGNFSNTQSVDITVGEANILKKPDSDGERQHSMERKSLVFSAKKDPTFSMKSSPKGAKTIDFQDGEDDNAISEYQETNPHMRTNLF